MKRKGPGKGMAVELWDDSTGNLIDDFEDEKEALILIRDVVARDGKTAIKTWALDRLVPSKEWVRGEDLYQLAGRGQCVAQLPSQPLHRLPP